MSGVDNLQPEYNYNFCFKLVLVLYLIILLFIFSKDDISFNVKLCALLIFYIMLCIAYLNDSPNQKKPEQFCGNLNKQFCSSNEHYSKPLTRRQQEIRRLNNNRCTEGHFYVDCHSCGRDRVLDDKLDVTIDRCLSLGMCPELREKKMSYFNTHYVDSNKIFSYGGNLIDVDDKNIARIQTYGSNVYAKPYDGTYVYWPRLKDPVNGPPYV